MIKISHLAIDSTESL